MKTLLFAGLHKPFLKKRFFFYSLSLCSICSYAQNVPQDSTKVNELMRSWSKPFRQMTKHRCLLATFQEELETEIGQDIPILLNFLPSVVTTDAEWFGYTRSGSRVWSHVNVTVNGILQ
jgi:iron complex outermembrane receptor protein